VGYPVLNCDTQGTGKSLAKKKKDEEEEKKEQMLQEKSIL